MIKNRMMYILFVIALINLVLLMMILLPHMKRLQNQVENGGALPAGVFVPSINDYYFDFEFVSSHKEGDWQVDTYEEVKRLVDVNGHKIKDIPTGNFEYMRYFIGDDPDEVLYDLMEEEDHDLMEHDHSK